MKRKGFTGEQITFALRQAVYNALGMLAEKDLIWSIHPAGSRALYEDRVGDNHHHVIFRTCGTTVDVDRAAGETDCLTAAADLGYKIDEAEVIYWGTCPECLAETSGGMLNTNKTEPRNKTSQLSMGSS